jgi:hypothetical protein
VIYVASKSCHAPVWQSYRSTGFSILSTWIDEAGPGESDLPDLWCRCIAEASDCSVLVALHRPDEEWKGALVEIGAALAHGRPVFLVGDPPGSWVNHPLVSRFPMLWEAMVHAQGQAAPRPRS